jgi:hypothetical protein
MKMKISVYHHDRLVEGRRIRTGVVGVCFTHGGVEIDLGTFGANEAGDLAAHLREVADELDPPDAD